MHIKQSHITKKYALLTLLFFVSIMGTIVSVVANDSTVDTRANTIFEAIKSNAKQMNPSDVSAYYSLVRMNIATLMQVLTQVDQKLAQELEQGTTNPPTPPSTFIDFQANNCTIPAGKSLCMATLYIGAPTGKIYSVKNNTRAITSANIITPNNYSTTMNKYVLTTTFSGDDAANVIKYGENNLELIENDKVIARAINMAECVTGTKWNGQVCQEQGATSKPTISLNRTPKTLKPGQSMMMSWETTNATSFSYYCTGTGVQANKKVPIELNAKPYSNTWENLTKIGWSGSYDCDFVAVGPGGSTTMKDSFIIEPPTITTPPSDVAKLTFTCSKSVYSVGENISCRISGGNGAPGTKYCYQSGTSSANKALCTSYGWNILGTDLVYAKTVTENMAGDYTLFVEDDRGNKASTVVVYKSASSPTFIDFQANNCTIPAGKSLCMATLYIGAPTGKIYSVKNNTRAITSANIITPNNYSTTMNKYVLTTTFSGDDAANVIKYGENNLELIENDKVIARAINMAECVTGTKWNGQVCQSATLGTGSTNTGVVSFNIDNGVLTRNIKTGEYLYQVPGTTPHSFSCYYRPTDLLGNLARLNYISNSTASNSELIRKLTTFVSQNGGNTTGPDPYGILFENYPNVGAYCPSYVKPMYIDFQANNCKIGAGKSSCMATLYVTAPTGKIYTVKNTTRAITSGNIITPANYSSVDKKYILTGSISGADAANFVKYGENYLQLLEGDKEIAKAVNMGECDTGLKWNGTMCAATIVVTPSSGTYTISNKNTLSAIVTGLKQEDTLICNEIIAHPVFPNSVNTGFCNTPSNFKPFTGNDVWSFKDGRWFGNMGYNPSVYGTPGIKTRIFWKDKLTNIVATYDVNVVQGTPTTPVPYMNLAIPGYPAGSTGYLPIKVDTVINIDYNVTAMRQCRAWYSKTGESTGFDVTFTGKNADGSSWSSNRTEDNPTKGTFQLRIAYPMTLVFTCTGYDGKTYSESIPFQTKKYNDTDTYIETNISKVTRSGESVAINWQANREALSSTANYCHISKQHTVNGVKASPTVFLATSINLANKNSGTLSDIIASPGKYVYVLMCNNDADPVPDAYAGTIVGSNEVIF